MPTFSSSIIEIANHIGKQVYLKGFPAESNPDTKKLNREKVMENSPPRVIHGFDNANRCAALIPYLVELLRRNKAELPLDLRNQLDKLNSETIKALQIVALMRASGRHYHPDITEQYGDNPDFGHGTSYASFGEVECLAMLKELKVPERLDLERLAHAVVGNEYVSSHHAKSESTQKAEHERSKNDLYCLLLNVTNVLETTRDLSKKDVDLNRIPLFQMLGEKGKKEFINLAKRHINFIKQHQGFLWTCTKVGSEVLVSPDDKLKLPTDYDGAKYTDANDMFEAMADVHGLINTIRALLKKYINSRAYENGQSYELTFVSKHFRNETLTRQKVGIAYQLNQELDSSTSYEGLKKQVQVAIENNTAAEKVQKKNYVVTGSGLGRVLHEIETLIDQAEHASGPIKNEGKAICF